MRCKSFFAVLCFFSVIAFGQDDSGFDPDAVLALDRDAFERTVRKLVGDAQDGRLGQIAARARETGARWDDAVWKLEVFYYAVDEAYSGFNSSAKYRFKQNNKSYVRDYPEMITPRVVLVKSYITDAWDARGSGWANTVSEDDWTTFFNNLETAERYGKDAMEIEEKDPELYAALIRVAGGLNQSHEVLYEYGKAGLAVEPGYLHIPRTMSSFLLPRWGAPVTEQKKLAEWCVEQTRETQGEALYFYIARCVADFEGEAQAIKHFGFEWPRIEKAYADYEKHHVRNDRLDNMVAALACNAGDRNGAKKWLDTLGDTADETVWTTEAMMHWKAWANGEAEPLELTQMHVAAQYGRLDALQAAVAAGADLDAMAPSGQRAIDYAVLWKQWPNIEYLLEQDIDFTKSADSCQYAMNLAAEEGRTDLVKKLVDGGIDATETHAIGYAARYGQIEIVRFLLDEGGCNVNQRVWGETTPLLQAAGSGHKDIVDLLLERGADVNLTAGRGSTALIAAAAGGQGDIVRTLIEEGADVTAKFNHKQALHFAAERGHVDALSALLSVPEVEVNEAVGDGMTALHAAAHEGKSNAVRLLIEHPDCNIEAVWGSHGTPLVAAAGEGQYDIVLLLLEHGANANATNGAGTPAAKLAEDNSHEEVAKLLRQHGAKD